MKPSFHSFFRALQPRRFFCYPLAAGLVLAAAVADASAQPRSGGSTSAGTPGKLDKKFYNDYLDSLPNEKRQQIELLEKNLLRMAVRAISREDSQEGAAFAKGLKPAALKYEKVGGDSPFVRGIFRELPYLRPTPFMWIVQTGAYTIFVSFRVDPRRFICEEFQVKTVKETTKEQTPPTDPHAQ